MKNIVIIVAVIILAVGGYMVFNKGSSDAFPSDGSAGKQTSVADLTAKGTAFTGSVADLVAKGDPTQCVLSAEPAQAHLYVSAGKVRLDVDLKTPEITMDKHVIFDGSALYAWDSTKPKEGSKKTISFEELKKADQTFTTKTTGYVCAPWSLDSSAFTAPSGITFSEGASATVQ